MNCKKVAMISIVLIAIIVLYSMIEVNKKRKSQVEIDKLRRKIKTLKETISNSYLNSNPYHQKANILHNLEEKERSHGLNGVFFNLFDYFLSNKWTMVSSLDF